MVHIPRDAPSNLIRYVRAAIVAYNLGTTFDHALDHFLSEDCSDVSAIHLAFQEMYYAGMEHIDNTQQRMNPQVEASAGEVFPMQPYLVLKTLIMLLRCFTERAT